MHKFIASYLGATLLTLTIAGTSYAAKEAPAASTVGDSPNAAAVPKAGKGASEKAADAKAKPKTEKFDDWALGCIEEGETKGCRLVQSASVKVAAKEGEEEKTQRVMISSVGYSADDKDQLTLSVIVPLGVLIQPGLIVEVEGYDQLKMPLQRCDTNGCVGILPMKSMFVEAMRRGKEAQVTFFGIDGKGNKVRMSLDGLDKGLDALAKTHPKDSSKGSAKESPKGESKDGGAADMKEAPAANEPEVP